MQQLLVEYSYTNELGGRTRRIAQVEAADPDDACGKVRDYSVLFGVSRSDIRIHSARRSS